MSDRSAPIESGDELQRLRAALAKATEEAAVLNAKLELMSRQIEDLRLQNYRLDAQLSESRIGRAVAEERAAAAREAAARKEGLCCSCHAPHLLAALLGGASGGSNPSIPQAHPQPHPHPHPHPQPQPQPAPRKLVIERMLVQQTPQTGTWLMCFMASAQSGARNLFHVPNRTYSGDGITIEMDLALAPVAAGERISFQCQLDDDEADVCGSDAEDKSSGEFVASESGSQVFSFDDWVYVLFWRME